MQSAIVPKPLPSWWQAALADKWQKGGFGLYVHWPYCVSKCPYCDFNSHVAQSVDQDIWREAYLSALTHYAAETGGRRLGSIYFGGGTPSLMRPDLVGAIIDAAQKYWVFDNDIEITLEANPGSVETGRFAGYRRAGVNRVSLGVQALNDKDLGSLGRKHTAREALSSLEVAQTHFQRVSFDLIYARQNQSLRDWERELTFALSFTPSHLSLYQLSIEPDTAFGARARAGKLGGLPSEELAADMYDITYNICKNNGLERYEVSSHALPSQESKHNMIYWQAGDYIGVGPGAHGRLSLDGKRLATETPHDPTAWLKRAMNGPGESTRQPLSGTEQATEYLLMGLRTRSGISLRRLKAMDDALLAPDPLRHLEELGLVEQKGDTLKVTPKGMPLLNAVLRELVA